MTLTSRLGTKRLDVPNDPGEWIELRAVGGRRLREAAAQKSRDALLQVRAAGGEIAELWQKNAKDTDTDTAKKDVLNTYDALTVCYVGIVGWSYEEKVKPATIDDLDSDTQDWAARQILELSLPRPTDAVDPT